MSLGIGQRKSRTPRATKYVPFIYAKVFPKLLVVLHEIPSGIFLEHCRRSRFPAASLVVQDDFVLGWIEELPILGICMAPRATVQKQHGRPVLFPLNS